MRSKGDLKPDILATNPTYRGDLVPFQHGEEGTHYACKEMTEKLGDKVGCCGCHRHECRPPQEESWADSFFGPVDPITGKRQSFAFNVAQGGRR